MQRLNTLTSPRTPPMQLLHQGSSCHHPPPGDSCGDAVLPRCWEGLRAGGERSPLAQLAGGPSSTQEGNGSDTQH